MNTQLSIDPERRTQAERSALSDALMLDAAVALICECGAAGTTLKDGLFAFIIHSIGDTWLHELRRAVQDEVGLEAIARATDAHYRFVTEGSDHIRAFYMLWFDSIGPDPDLKKVVANIHERRRRDVAVWIEKGIAAGQIDADVDIAGTAEQFCAAIIGIVYQWLATPEAEQHIQFLHESLKRQMALALKSGRN
jgi:BetI-type transcriptional repressor, C-terminal